MRRRPSRSARRFRPSRRPWLRRARLLAEQSAGRPGGRPGSFCGMAVPLIAGAEPNDASEFGHLRRGARLLWVDSGDSAFTDETRPSPPARGRPLHRLRLHCLLAGLRASRYVRVIATDIALRGGGARQGERRGSGARRIAWPCCSARSGSGIGEKRVGTFDAVVSNPPYVPTSVHGGNPPRSGRLRADALALDGGRRRPRAVSGPWSSGPPVPSSPAACLACELVRGSHGCRPPPSPRPTASPTCRIVNDLTERPRVLMARRG